MLLYAYIFQSRMENEQSGPGRIIINPSSGYPPDIHRISTLIGHKPDLDAYWPQTGGIYDFPAPDSRYGGYADFASIDLPSNIRQTDCGLCAQLSPLLRSKKRKW